MKDKDGIAGVRANKRRQGLQLFMENQLLEGQVGEISKRKTNMFKIYFDKTKSNDQFYFRLRWGE